MLKRQIEKILGYTWLLLTLPLIALLIVIWKVISIIDSFLED